jgi:hypothetical protein
MLPLAFSWRNSVRAALVHHGDSIRRVYSDIGEADTA